MSVKFCKANFIMKKLFFILLSVCFVTGNLPAEIVSKVYRERFSPDNLNSDYYKLQMKTASFFDKQTSAITGLIESFRNSSNYTYDLVTKSFIIGKGGFLDTQSFIYDGAVSAIAYLLAGQYSKAYKLLKIYSKEFYFLKSDKEGLCNAYRSDLIRTKNGLTNGIDGDRRHLGPNMWVAIAALQYTAVTSNLEFLEFAIDILKWAEQINHFKFQNGQLGAASMGYGWMPPDWSTVYSTENILDHYAALSLARDIFLYSNKSEVKNYFNKANYSLKDIEKELDNIERWLKLLVYDKEKQSFNMGYSNEKLDKTDALDTVSWAIAAITPEHLETIGINPFNLFNFAKNQFFVEDKINGEFFSGYDFTNEEGRNKNYRMIWFEGTCFHIVAIQVLADYAQKTGKWRLAEQYRDHSKFLLNQVNKAAGIIGLSDGALPYTSKNPKEKERLLAFNKNWEIPRGKNGKWVASTSSTAWYLIALSAFNPLHFDRVNVKYSLFSKNKK